MTGGQRSGFDRFSTWASDAAGRSPAFLLALALIVVWLIEGVAVVAAHQDAAYFLDSQYQLQINSPTTIITFLLLFLVQGTQNRNDKAVHLKLDALIDASQASNRLTQVEELDAKELASLHEQIEAEIADRGIKDSQ